MRRRFAYRQRYGYLSRLRRLGPAAAILMLLTPSLAAASLQRAWASEGFEPAESAGLFVGVSQFEEPYFAGAPFAVDDAVDLAHLFAVELELIPPSKVIMALAGEPQKPESQARLADLIAAGAIRSPSHLTQIYRLLFESAKSAGPRGLFVVTFSTHGFTDQGGDFLIAADSLQRLVRSTSVSLEVVFENVARARSPRRLVLVDACRERLSAARSVGRGAVGPAMSASFAEAISQASGQAVISSSTPGGYTYDDFDLRNGVFTAAVLEGLRGAAPADPRGFITVQTLADYVASYVSEWVRENRPDHVALSRGVTFRLDGGITHLPLAVNPSGGGPQHEYRQRREAALALVRENLSGPEGPISGAVYDEIFQALPGELPVEGIERTFVEKLLDKIEALDGTLRPQRSLVSFLSTSPVSHRLRATGQGRSS